VHLAGAPLLRSDRSEHKPSSLSMMRKTNTPPGAKVPNAHARARARAHIPDPNPARDTTTTTGRAAATAVSRAASVLEARASSIAFAPSREALTTVTPAEIDRIARTAGMIVVGTTNMIILAPRTRGMGRRLRRGEGGGGIIRG
jgi:hypothetical protein